jgi:DNA-binding protein Fis
MITILVLDDDNRVFRLLSEVLETEGYSVLTEPHTQGLIRIVRKGVLCNPEVYEKRIVDLNDILFLERDGDMYKRLLTKVEKPLIEAALEKTDGNQLKAAKLLGINRNTLRAKIKKLGINAEQWKSP